MTTDIARRTSRSFVLASLRALHLDLRHRKRPNDARIEEGPTLPRRQGAVSAREHKPNGRTGCGRLARRNAVTNDEQSHPGLGIGEPPDPYPPLTAGVKLSV